MSVVVWIDMVIVVLFLFVLLYFGVMMVMCWEYLVV